MLKNKKYNQEVIDFIVSLSDTSQSVEIANRVDERYGLEIHPYYVSFILRREGKKKKRVVQKYFWKQDKVDILREICENSQSTSWKAINIQCKQAGLGCTDVTTIARNNGIKAIHVKHGGNRYNKGVKKCNVNNAD